MLKPGDAAAEDVLHISLNKTVFIIMTSNRAGLEFSGTLESAGLSLFLMAGGIEDRILTA